MFASMGLSRLWSLVCAGRAFPEDVPSKAVWIRRELICHKPTIGETASGRGKLDFPRDFETATYPLLPR